MRCLASFPLALLFLGCSATSSGHAACSGCDCNTTVETCPSQCFPTYTDQPDGGVAFSCGSAAPPDPGVFDPYYFYCHVEPDFLFAYRCGAGDPSKGDPPNGCHYTGSAVSGMVLIAHPPVDCGGGNAPIDPSTIGKDAPIDLQAASLEMTRDYTSAPIFVRPSSNNGVPPTGHPRAVFDQSDPKAWEILSTWASIP